MLEEFELVEAVERLAPRGHQRLQGVPMPLCANLTSIRAWSTGCWISPRSSTPPPSSPWPAWWAGAPTGWRMAYNPGNKIIRPRL